MGIKVFIQPPHTAWAGIQARPAVQNNDDLLARVKSIMQEVRSEGDPALLRYNQLLDKHNHPSLEVSAQEMAAAEYAVPQPLQRAIQQAKANIEKFHQQQLAPGSVIETMPGVFCWRKSIGINKVGLYIPGGSAPLFSTVLMLGIPAALVSCEEVILCTPGGKNGEVNPAILYAAQLVGIQRVFRVGGAQAIAAMTYGTATIPAVYKIFGPGNSYVTAAKQLANAEGTAIDMPAGPSEVLVYADDTAPAAWVAADLLSQAEHGPDSQVILVCDSEAYAQSIITALEEHLKHLDRANIARAALSHSRIVVLPEQKEAISFINLYAAEHLIIARKDADAVAEQITQAGSVFLGYHSPESVGDYASGTNHTLPTYGFARAYSGVSVDSFVKKITFQRLTPEGLQNIGPTVITMAEAEHLDAHALAVQVRLNTKTPS